MSDQQMLAAGMGNYKQSFSLADIELETQFSAIYQHPLHNQYFPESSGNFHHDNSTLQQRFDVQHSQSKRKAEATISDSSPDQNCVGRGKKVRRQEKKEAKSAAEVVHVRARRGQATDSHSLAERVRRERINERLRCLQDIVPGCYKTMGMAVMLDEIINYVQSLQNQVEFLSMKLTAATTFYDVSSHADASGTMQIAKAFEASEMQNGLFSHGVPSAQLAPLLPSTFHTTNAKI